jgi:hypothetical protein
VHCLGTRHDIAFDEHHGFETDTRRDSVDLGRTRSRIEGDLNHTRAVAKIDERKATEIATPVHPAAKPNAKPDVRRTQGAAKVCTMGRREKLCRHQ